jgi:hypothetical protein
VKLSAASAAVEKSQLHFRDLLTGAFVFHIKLIRGDHTAAVLAFH